MLYTIRVQSDGKDAVDEQDALAANQKINADKESTQHQQQQKDDATPAAAGERTEKVDCTANVTLKFTMDSCSSKRPKKDWPSCCNVSWLAACLSDQYETTVTSDMLNRKDNKGHFIPFEVGRMVNQGGCDFKYSLVCGDNKGYPTLLQQIAPCEEQCKDPKALETWEKSAELDKARHVKWGNVTDAQRKEYLAVIKKLEKEKVQWQREARGIVLNHGSTCVSTPENLYGDKDFQKCPQDRCSKPEKENSEFPFGSGFLPSNFEGFLMNSKYAKIDMQKDEGFFQINNAEKTLLQWGWLNKDDVVSVKFTVG